MTARESPEERARKARDRFRIVKDEDEVVAAITAEEAHATDLGNAKRLVERHGADLRYCKARNSWLVWDGRRWAWDESGETERRAKETVLSWYSEAAELPSKERKKLISHAMKCEAVSRLKAMIDLTRTESGVPVAMADLDRDPWALNCQNGTLDLRSGELRPHCRHDLMTRLVPVDYDPLEECPAFLAFLTHIMAGKDDLIQFLQRAIGYSLTGLTVERCMFILWGGGKNGKSTLLDTLLELLADHAARVNTDTLMATKYAGIPNDIAALKGMRFVFASEGEQGRRLAEAKIKDITGGDTISARFMRGEWFSFRPEFKIWLGTNHKPEVHDTSDAIWDRIRLIPFAVRIPPEEQDKTLKDRLLKEGSGILAWAVEGCLAWQRDGLQEPAEVVEATQQYRSSEDIIGRFLGDRCEFHQHASVTKKALYGAYKSWCDEFGEKSITQKAFGMRLNELGLDEAFAGSSKDRARIWLGLALLAEEESNDRT